MCAGAEAGGSQSEAACKAQLMRPDGVNLECGLQAQQQNHSPGMAKGQLPSSCLRASARKSAALSWMLRSFEAPALTSPATCPLFVAVPAVPAQPRCHPDSVLRATGRPSGPVSAPPPSSASQLAACGEDGCRCLRVALVGLRRKLAIIISIGKCLLGERLK